MPVSGADQVGENPLLFRDAVVLDFNKVVVACRNPLVFQGDPLRLLVIASHQIAGDLPRQTRRRQMSPSGCAQLSNPPGAGCKTIPINLLGNQNQVLIAGVVLTEEHQVVGGCRSGRTLSNRVRGATYTSQPMMGLIPSF